MGDGVVGGDDGKKVGWGHAPVFGAHSTSNRASRNFEVWHGQIRSMLSKIISVLVLCRNSGNQNDLWKLAFFFFFVTWFVFLL